MIVSHEHRFVFVEVPRTGTTAISAELRENYDCESVGRKHATLAEVSQEHPELEAYKLFAGKRNPLDAQVSLYFKLRNNHGGHYTDEHLHAVNGGWIGDAMLEMFHFVQDTDATFAEFLGRFARSVRSLEWRDDQRRALYVSPFEDLQTGFSTMLSLAGVEQLRPLPAVNTTGNRSRDFLTYYTPDIRQRALEVFGPLMLDLGYEIPYEWEDRSVPLKSRIAYAVAGVAQNGRVPTPVRSVARRPVGKLRRLAVGTRQGAD